MAGQEFKVLGHTFTAQRARNPRRVPADEANSWEAAEWYHNGIWATVLSVCITLCIFTGVAGPVVRSVRLGGIFRGRRADTGCLGDFLDRETVTAG